MKKCVNGEHVELNDIEKAEALRREHDCNQQLKKRLDKQDLQRKAIDQMIDKLDIQLKEELRELLYEMLIVK